MTFVPFKGLELATRGQEGAVKVTGVYPLEEAKAKGRHTKTST